MHKDFHTHFPYIYDIMIDGYKRLQMIKIHQI